MAKPLVLLLSVLLLALASVPALSRQDVQAPTLADAADLPTPTTQCGGTVSFSDVPAEWFLTIWPGGDPDLLATTGFDSIKLNPGTYSYMWHGAQDLANLARTDIRMGGGTFTIDVCPTPTPTPASPDPVLIGAGDICHSGSEMANAYATAALISARPSDLVFTAGDNSNETGSQSDYDNCVAPTWGVFRDRTHPAPGNHDYDTAGAVPYYAFYPQAAGPAGLGWYSYNLSNSWHVIVLNAMCDDVGGCDAGSPQEQWLKADLAANPGKHFIAIWHMPSFSSGSRHGNSPDYLTWWQDLSAAHASIIINGHDHDYERFAPQSPTATAVSDGIREFVVGTGGAAGDPFGAIQPNSEVRASGIYGVLELTLHADSYDWQFIPAAGSSFSDSGTAATVSPDSPR